MAEINELIIKKVLNYPKEIQNIIIKTLELAEHNRETAVAEQLEGYLRNLYKAGNSSEGKK